MRLVSHKNVLLIVFVVFLLVLSCGYSIAQKDTDEQTSIVTLVIVPVANLTISNSDVSEILVSDANSEPVFSDGYIDFTPERPTLTIDANKKWKLSVRSSGFSGPYSKDIKDLMLRDTAIEHVKNGFSDYRSLTDQDQEIAWHNSGVKDEAHTCQYRILLDWAKDIPGTYQATVTYTLSTVGT